MHRIDNFIPDFKHSPSPPGPKRADSTILTKKRPYVKDIILYIIVPQIVNYYSSFSRFTIIDRTKDFSV
jgi:hypothetical protein